MILLLMISLAFSVHAQKKTYFVYDESGNRVLRTIEKIEEEITETTPSEFDDLFNMFQNPEDPYALDLTVYPNPTQDGIIFLTILDPQKQLYQALWLDDPYNQYGNDLSFSTGEIFIINLQQDLVFQKQILYEELLYGVDEKGLNLAFDALSQHPRGIYVALVFINCWYTGETYTGCVLIEKE